MINLGMRSWAASVKGQGVGSAYMEIISLLKKFGKNDFSVTVNHGLSKSDVIHCHTIDPISLLTMKFSRKPTIASVHFVPETMKGSLQLPPPIPWLFNRYMLSFYKSADYVHIVNPQTKEDLMGYGVAEDKIRYIPNVVSPEGFSRKSPEEIQGIRKRLGFSETDFVVVGIGQLQKKKGIQSFAKVARHLPKVKFVWIGGFSFGRMSDGYGELKKLVENPPENLRFTDIIPREEVGEYLNAADLFFLPSFHEQCCMAVLEAAGTKTPILLRDLDSYKQLYPDCYLAGSGIRDFTMIIRKLQKDKAFCREWAQRSAGISERYSESKIYSMWKALYTECVKR